jgi:hypothetical protein
VTPVNPSYTFMLATQPQSPPDWVCITTGCDEALPAGLFETRTADQPKCVRCGARMCPSPYARAEPR